MAELTVSERYITEEEYLAIERVAEEKSEYFAGRMYAMPGVKRPHSLIVTELVIILGNTFKGQECEIHANDMRVRVLANGLYTYPDIAFVLGESQYMDDEIDTLQNPTLIIEVLSRSTEAYDRGKKFELYKGLESLRDYVLVSQAEPKMERFSRQPDETWLQSTASGLEASLHVETVVTFDFASIYARVKFETNAPLRLSDGESR